MYSSRWWALYFLSLCQNGDQQQADLCIEAGLSKQPQITVPVSEHTSARKPLYRFLYLCDCNEPLETCLHFISLTVLFLHPFDCKRVDLKSEVNTGVINEWIPGSMSQRAREQTLSDLSETEASYYILPKWPLWKSCVVKSSCLIWSCQHTKNALPVILIKCAIEKLIVAICKI